MAGIEHILVPTDGSTGAIKAATYAGELARALGSRVTLLYVQDSESMLSGVLGLAEFAGGVPANFESTEDVRRVLEKQARERELPETSQALGDGDTVAEMVTVWGHPADEIVKFVEEHAVDLVVIGSHGRSGLQRAFLGSVSQSVANQVSCPITIVK
ncbi:MAG: universal stress protein [Pseudomonadota bacterium]